MKVVPTRRTDYGIRALIYLAQHPDEQATAAAIGEAMEIPIGFLHQVLQALQRARMVQSRSGRSGGYFLARPASDITVLEIVEALEGPVTSEECVLRGGPCHWEEVCAIHWVWSSAQRALEEKLANATLATVAEDDLLLAQGKREVPADAHRGRRRSAPRPARSAGSQPARGRKTRRTR